MAEPIITLTSDFGLRDSYVASMKGVILGIHPEARLVDVTHLVPPHDIQAGAYILESVRRSFPPGTVHLAVVDPGVGTNRKGILIEVDGQALVGPDNGLFSLVLRRREDIRAHYLESPRYWLPTVSRTFHGRDVFAPVAAHYAKGIPGHAFGPPAIPHVSPWSLPVKEGPDLVRGEVIAIDHFGNCVTNITPEELGGAPRSGEWSAEVASRRDIPVLEAYGDVDPSVPVAVMGSGGCLEIAVNLGNAAGVLDIRRGSWVWVTRRLWARRGVAFDGGAPGRYGKP